jgi:subtilisin family serine protease
VYRIWLDHEVRSLLTESVRTVKADAARVAFAAEGRDIVWAVIDSGVDGWHPHFTGLQNLELTAPLQHFDFLLPDPALGPSGASLQDDFGHGSHVAGIIAGGIWPGSPMTPPLRQVQASQTFKPGPADTVRTSVQYRADSLEPNIRGVAPMTRILSMRVLDGTGTGRSSRIIAAIEKILEINDYGRRILIQGVNLSLGYWFDPEWFACGQSPLCVAVDRLVRSGVVVVVAAGNSGYVQTDIFRGASSVNKAGQLVSINDPGNAFHAITVGSTHRNMPHIYGVSYFSSKGPTGDGRRKPDLVAPGEKIISCGAGKILADALAKGDPPQAPQQGTAYYLEYSGTSMAAPHVSGAIAAFLSVRREFIGQPERVKEIFMKSATDLGRHPSFQGAGMLDLMRAIQSI